MSSGTPVSTAFVDIRPSFVGFEAELTAGVASAIRTAPLTTGLTKAAAGQTALATSTRRTTKALSEQAAVMQVESTNLARFTRGVAATGLAQFGLRGATLAATSAFLAGAAALTALSKAVGVAVSFNSQLAVFGATTGATKTQLQGVSEAAKALGRDFRLPGVSATDAAVAMTELAKAGLSVEDAIAGARGVLLLATAANIDNAQATELAANAINAFGLAGERATVVADTLANAANASQGSIVDIGIAFQQSAAVAHLAGLSFRDTALFLTELAKAGLTGSDAGTSFRTAITRLINPTTKAREAIKNLGVEIRDSQGRLRPDFFVNLGNALERVSKKQRDATLAIIGGQDAIRALAILSTQSINDQLALGRALDKQGTAAEVAGARLTGLAGAGANLRNTIESIALNLGQKATPSLIGATDAIREFITAAAQSPAIGLLGETLHTTADAVGSLAHALGAMTPLIGTFIGTVAGITSAIGPGAILSTAAALLVLNRAIKAVAVSNLFAGLGVGIPIFTRLGLAAGEFAETLRVSALTAGVAFSSFRNLGLGVRALASSLAAAALSTSGLLIGATLAAGAIFFLATRESETERQTRRLSAATNDLVAALRDADTASSALSRSQGLIHRDQLDITSARLAARQAQAALAISTAGAGTTERAQLENNLAIQLDRVDQAEQQLVSDRKELSGISARAIQAEKNLTEALADEAKQLQSTITLNQQRQAVGEVSFFGGTKSAIADTTAELLKQAAAQRKLDTDESLATAQRLESLALLASRVKDFPGTVAILLNSSNLDAGLKNVEKNLRATGQQGAADFTEALRVGLSPETFLARFRSILSVIPAAFGQAGTESGAAFGQTLLAGVQAVIVRTNNLISQGLLAVATRLSNQTDTLLQNVQRAGLTGGSLSEQLAIAQEARRRAERELAAADAAVRKATTPKARGRAQDAQKKALQDLAASQGDIDRIEGEIASNAKQAADARQKKIDDAKRAKDKADRAFLDLLSGERGAFDLRFAIAQGTKTLSDDISAQQAFTGELTREIAVIQRSALSEADKATAIQQLRVERQRSINATKELVATQNAAARQAIIDRRDRAQEALEIDVQIAETNKNKAKELKAHQALLRFLIERRKHTGQASIERKRLTLEIEREKATIAELQKATKSRNDALKALEFTFLQTQSGFVANLLGNLLPTGSVAGTLGGGAISTAAPTVPSASFGTAVHRRPPDVPAAAFATAVHQRGKIDKGFQAASQTGATAGASFGQLSVLITIAREQLAVLRAATGQKAHPEAAVQRSVQNAASDILPW